jgi:beta-barrel assembly-enhancing protease
MTRYFWVAAAAVVLLLSLILTAQAGTARLRVSDMPKGATTQADIEAEIQFGRTLAARILGRYPLHANQKLQRYVGMVGQRLAASCGRPELPFAFAVIDSEERNAFATPGGYIFVTSAALEQMRDEAELAGVLGHEIGHVSARHMVKALHIRGVDRSAGAGLASLVGGATASVRGALQQSLARATEMLFQEGYAAAEELEADELGLFLAALSGYDAGGLERFLGRVGSFEPGAAASPSHPLHAKRMTALATGRRTLEVTDEAAARRYAARFQEHARW